LIELVKVERNLQICLIDFIWNIPTKRTELLAFLNDSVDKAHGVKHGAPFLSWHAVKHVLVHPIEASLQSCFHSLNKFREYEDREIREEQYTASVSFVSLMAHWSKVTGNQ
jgi:hypothetical protein